MDEAIAGHGLTVAQSGGFGGSSFWMRAPEGVDTGLLADRLKGQGVLIEPVRVFFDPAGGPQKYYRLAYSSIPGSRIAEGIGRIADEIGRSAG